MWRVGFIIVNDKSVIMSKTIIDDHPPLDFKYLTDKISNFALLEKKEQILFIDEVVSAHAVLNFAVFLPYHTFYRVRNIDGISIDHVQDILWPITTTTLSNRFGNLCYLANSDFVALAETEPKPRDDERQTVVITRFQMIKGEKARILPIGETDMIVRTGRGFFTPEADAKRIQNLGLS